jgi:3'-phosphoadenosine 5'-phosphosulfate sulfotransferase (PAPS reductase)/FAD synthetase
MPKDTIELLPLEAYDRVVVASSGGKDSLACLLYLLERGVPAERLELWHHLIDGAPGSPALMDWPVTGSYVRALAAAFGLALRQSWREGGFEREMTRSETPTGPVRFELDDGTLGQAGGRGPAGTRRKFPQVSADLKVRWCSAYLKVDVGRAVFSNVARYARGRFLFVTGERREESPARSRYAAVQPHESSTRARRVDHWRAVLDWPESEVWDVIRRWRVRPHPAYYLGFGRVSCAACIFGQPDQWASVQALLPEQFERVAGYEAAFGVTIKKGMTVRAAAARGRSFVPPDERQRALALAGEYPVELVRLGEAEEWVLPAGAFRRHGGPT